MPSPAARSARSARSLAGTRRSLAIAAVVVLGLVVACAVRFGSAAMFSLVLAVPSVSRVTAPFVQSTLCEPAEIPFGSRTLTADVYRPAHPRGAILLVHGLSTAGRRQPDLARLAELLARHGQLALVPQFEGLAAFRLDGTEVAAVVAALDHAARLANPVAIAGFSFGAGPALLAAAERPGTRLAGSFGGYADLRSVITFITTDAGAEPYNRWKLLQLLAGLVDDAHDRAGLDVIARAKLASPFEDTSRRESALRGGRRHAGDHPDCVPPYRAPLARRDHAFRRTRRLEAREPHRGPPERPQPLRPA